MRNIENVFKFIDNFTKFYNINNFRYRMINIKILNNSQGYISKNFYFLYNKNKIIIKYSSRNVDITVNPLIELVILNLAAFSDHYLTRYFF